MNNGNSNRFLRLAITPDDSKCIKNYFQIVSECLPKAIDVFFVHLMRNGHKEYFNDHSVEDIKIKKLKHWLILFDGPLDDMLGNYIRVIGKVHENGAIPRFKFVNSYGYFLICLLDQIEAVPLQPKSDRQKLRNAIIKYVNFGMMLASESYGLGHFRDLSGLPDGSLSDPNGDH